MTYYKGAGILLFDNNKVLLQLRDDKPNIGMPNMWSIPGGGKEKDETYRECALREFKEETNYLLTNKDIIFFTSTRYSLDNKTLCGLNAYIAKYDKKQRIECLEGQKMEFKTAKEVLEIENINPMIKQFIILGFSTFNALEKTYLE